MNPSNEILMFHVTSLCVCVCVCVGYTITSHTPSSSYTLQASEWPHVNVKPALIKPEQLREAGGSLRFQSRHPELLRVRAVEPIALKTCRALLSHSASSSLVLVSVPSEKRTTAVETPSKPPVVPMPPKAPEDKTPITHFGVIIHDRGRCELDQWEGFCCWTGCIC